MGHEKSFEFNHYDEKNYWVENGIGSMRFMGFVGAGSQVVISFCLT